MKKKCVWLPFALVFLAAVLAGCFKDTYPGDRIREAIADICRSEYGIDQIEVRTAGDTVGVYLPMDKLFAADFKEVLKTGQVGNLEKLFEPSPEAFDKIENVLFSISRALLSTDKAFQFYVLAAADVRQTGQQITIIGSVNDIRRVRIWDISKNEYRRRIVTEWGYNPLALWHQPVRQFFRDLETLPVEAIRRQYFNDEVSNDVIQNLFFNRLLTNPGKTGQTRWEFLDLKSLPLQKSERVVFAKMRPALSSEAKRPTLPDPVLRYLLLISLKGDHPQLVRVIPFQFLDAGGDLKEIALPDDLEFNEEDENWEEEFQFGEIKLGPFLADQLTRRIQTMLTEDERIHNTFKDLKLDFQYEDAEPPPYFSLNIDAVLQDAQAGETPMAAYHEDLAYLIRKILPEFLLVVKSYRFDRYEFLKLNMIQESFERNLAPGDMESYQKKKIDLKTLLKSQAL